MKLCCDVIRSLAGQTLATAESCTGGLIGGALTAVAGSSAVYKGGIVSYTNEVKEEILGVDATLLRAVGAVSAEVAEAMAVGAKSKLLADVAISTTGLAGPGGDDYGNPVGAVFIGYADNKESFAKKFHFSGDRESVRRQAVEAALHLLLEQMHG